MEHSTFWINTLYRLSSQSGFILLFILAGCYTDYGFARTYCDRANTVKKFGVSDKWSVEKKPQYGTASFTVACKALDVCYTTLGQRKTGCDYAFFQMLGQACKHAFKNSYTALKQCNTLAKNAREFVNKNNGSAYRAAQRHAKYAKRDADRKIKFNQRRRKRLLQRRKGDKLR